VVTRYYAATYSSGVKSLNLVFSLVFNSKIPEYDCLRLTACNMQIWFLAWPRGQLKVSTITEREYKKASECYAK
jgi:hypothetical protein